VWEGCLLSSSNVENALRLLEVAATEMGDSDSFLSWTVELFASSASEGCLVEIAARWDIEPDEISETSWQTAERLTTLEKRRRRWRFLDESVLPGANCQAMADFAGARKIRVPTTVRRTRLRVIEARCLATLQDRERYQWIQDFIDGSSGDGVGAVPEASGSIPSVVESGESGGEPN